MMSMQINPPALLMHFLMPPISVVTGVGTVTAGIVIGVIVSQQIVAFRNSQIVLQSPTQIVLNRIIKLNELPYYYNVLDTMDVFVEDVNQVLKTKFGKKFAKVEITNFAPTPYVTSSNKKKSLKKRILRQGEGGNSTSSSSTTTTTSGITSYTTDVTASDNCTISVLNSNCPTLSEDYNKKCFNELTPIWSCSNVAVNVVQCVNKTVPVYNCSSRINDIITCDNSATTIRLNCFNQANTTTSTTVSATATTSQCEPPKHATVRSSIVTAKMFLYFVVKRTESISVEDIITALKNMKPPITLYNVCKKPSSCTSSFNDTLSQVEPPIQIRTSVEVLNSQPNIPSSLQQSVNNAANQAAQDAGLLSTSTETPQTSQSPQ